MLHTVEWLLCMRPVGIVELLHTESIWSQTGISSLSYRREVKQVSQFIFECLQSDLALSLTTKLWSSDVCALSLLSLTIQKIDSSFTLKNKQNFHTCVKVCMEMT